MPQDPSAALSALLRGASIQDHEEVLKAANAAIKANRSDNVAQHTRVVALLKLDRFDDALRNIREGGVKVEAQCAVEKVYALYKLNKLDEATIALKGVGLSKRSISHVAAQVAYRSENFDEVDNIYRRLLESGAAEEESDIKINMRATAAQSEWQGLVSASKALSKQPPDTFELCYNAACAHIARGSLDVAASFLQRAVMLCDGSDELTDEDKEAEIRPIRAQQAYVFARQGKLKEALDIYQSLGSHEDSDPDVVAVAQNNLAVLESKPTNPFLLQRKVAAWDSAKTDAKLFKYQSSVLARNNLLVDLEARKVDGVLERTHKALKQAELPSIKAEINTTSIVNAAAATQGKSGKDALGDLNDLAKKRPNDLGPILSIIQIQLQRRQGGAALSVLEAFLKRLESSDEKTAKDVRFSPGMIALAVSLMRSEGRETSAKAELVNATKHWETRPAKDASSLLREAGIELAKSSNPDDLALAGSAFQKLDNENQGSEIVSAGLVASLAASNASKVQEHIAKLPPVESLTKGIDVQALATAGVATLPSTGASRKRPFDDDANDPKAASSKKPRRRKLPKNFVEGKIPDPERWLPVRDRSSYRPPKGKKGKKRAGGEATQGGMVKDEETLGLVGGGGVKVEKAAGAKKKKKGKK